MNSVVCSEFRFSGGSVGGGFHCGGQPGSAVCPNFSCVVCFEELSWILAWLRGLARVKMLEIPASIVSSLEMCLEPYTEQESHDMPVFANVLMGDRWVCRDHPGLVQCSACLSVLMESSCEVGWVGFVQRSVSQPRLLGDYCERSQAVAVCIAVSI